MKNKLLILMSLSILLLTACQKSGGGDSMHVDPPADTAMYRGAITSVEKDGSDTLFVLKQAEGTDFGNAVITVKFNGSTNYKFKLEDATEGKYLEVYYGAAAETDATTGATAESIAVAAANLYPSADIVLFNGTILSMTKTDDKNGSLNLESLGDGEEVVFKYGDDSQIYLDLAALKEGDAVNVFFNGVYAESFPPQATITELRPYSAS